MMVIIFGSAGYLHSLRHQKYGALFNWDVDHSYSANDTVCAFYSGVKYAEYSISLPSCFLWR